LASFVAPKFDPGLAYQFWELDAVALATCLGLRSLPDYFFAHPPIDKIVCSSDDSNDRLPGRKPLERSDFVWADFVWSNEKAHPRSYKSCETLRAFVGIKPLSRGNPKVEGQFQLHNSASWNIKILGL
jgi:hypothetical protein